jgi:hypothetical protein
MGLSHLNIMSSSRIEGEFSWLWLLRLTSASTLCKSVVKMRWASHRRHHKKQKSIEDWLSTTLKQKCPQGLKSTDWLWLDKVMTPHHMKAIVKKILAASNYASQLTALTPDVIEFAVWRSIYDDDPCDSEDDHGPAEEVEEDGDVDADAIQPDDAPEVDDATQPVNVPDGNFFFEGARNTEGVSEHAHQEQPSKVPTRLPPFLYRHIRVVKLVKEEGSYRVTCSCDGCHAVCSPCTHMFLIFEHVAPDMTLAQLPWHPRNTKIHYLSALFENDSCPLTNLIQTVVTSSPVPKIPSHFVETWLEKTTHAPSSDGVPRGGRLDEQYEACDDFDGDVGAFETERSSHVRPTSTRRQQPPDKVAADLLHWQVTECLGKQHSVYKEYCEVIKNFRDDLQRRGIEYSGSGKRFRTKAFWEGGSAHKIDKVSKVARGDEHPSPSEVTGMLEEVAREHLLAFGAAVNTILEIHPDAKARRAGQRWFMIVKKANVVKVEGKSSIESCRWCKTNTLQPCPIFKDLIHCNIQEVKAYGVRDAPIFKDVITKLRVIADPPAPDPAPSTAPTTPAPWLTEKVAVKFVQGEKKDAVILVTLQEMKEQMLQRGVKGVDECSCKEDLTALMRTAKFVFDSKLFKSVPATAPSNQEILEHVRQMPFPSSVISSDRDDDAPISKGINPAAAAAASKRFWAAAQTAKVPQHVSKKPAPASLFCTCSGAELRSEKCSFCLQFLLE